MKIFELLEEISYEISYQEAIGINQYQPASIDSNHPCLQVCALCLKHSNQHRLDDKSSYEPRIASLLFCCSSCDVHSHTKHM